MVAVADASSNPGRAFIGPSTVGLRAFAAVALDQGLMPANQGPIARYAGPIDRAVQFDEDASRSGCAARRFSFGSSAA